jgi:hypothetical protein
MKERKERKKEQRKDMENGVAGNIEKFYV